MANAVKIAKRVPLIKFPNRKGAQAQAQVSRPSSGATKSEPVPSLPAGTATSQPYRTRPSQEEIEYILLGGAGP